MNEPAITKKTRRLERIWWLHPAWMFSMIVGGTMLLALIQSNHSYLLYNTPKYLNATHGWMTAGVILVFVIGCQVAMVTGRIPKPVDPSYASWFVAFVFATSALAIFGYLVWLAVAVKNGFSLGMLREVLTGDDADLTYSLATEIFQNVPGVTTCTQFASAAVPLGVWLVSIGHRRVLLPVLFLLVAGLTRAFILSERIAFIELAVPSMVIAVRQYLLFKPIPWPMTLGVKAAPFLGVLCLALFLRQRRVFSVVEVLSEGF